MQNDNLLYMIARLYYIDKVKQNEIAKRFNLTSMSVSRYLKEAETAGIVTFNVKTPWNIEMEKSRRLCQKLNLKECTVIRGGAEDDIQQLLADYASDYISGKMRDDISIGISWGSTISKLVRKLPYMKVDNCRIVQLSGMFTINDYSITPQNIMSELANKLNAQVFTLNAPLYVTSEELRNMIMQEPSNQELLEQAGKCDMMIFGVSAMNDGATTIKSGIISQEDVEELRKQGSIGDVAGMYIDEHGDPCSWSKKNCFTGIPFDIISRSQDSICIAGETNKANVIQVAAERGFFNTLITSESIADALLQAGQE